MGVTDDLAAGDGFEADDTIVRLEFDDAKYAGLVVRVRDLSIGQLIDGVDVAWLFDATNREEAQDEEGARFVELVGLFASMLAGWNVRRKGVPVAANLEGLRSLDRRFLAPIIWTWIRSVIAVPAPLDVPSTGGDPSLEESIPMEPLSGSLAS